MDNEKNDCQGSIEPVRVRAKFKCISKKEISEGMVIEMAPVTSCKEGSENNVFFKYTPFGKLEMGTINFNASRYFEVGREYYLDFTKAE